VPGNVAAEMLQESGDVQAALAAAPHRKKLHLRFERGAASPMEARAVWARWSEPEHRLTVYDSTQSPTSIRGGLAVLFGLPESSVDVIAPDVGGGFGPKIMLFYPDELLVPFAAMQLGRPVKWTEDRQEHFTAVNHARGQVHEVEGGFDGESTQVHGREAGQTSRKLANRRPGSGDDDRSRHKEDLRRETDW